MDAHHPAKPSFKAIFFDIGDTLVFDTPPVQERLKSALAEFRRAYPPDAFEGAFRLAEDYVLNCYLKGSALDDPAVLTESLVILTGSLGDQLTIAQQQTVLQLFTSHPYTRSLHPSAIELVKLLKERGFIVGAISDWEPDLSSVLSDLRILPFFDSLSVSSLVGCTKPHAALFQDALRQNNVPACEALHIGDYFELDVLGALGAGMHVLHFDWKNRYPHSRYPRVTSFEELIDYCLALPLDLIEADHGAI